MIEYNRVELGKAAKERGFVRDTFEKVLRLKEILRYFNEDEYLREHLVLKGGTAINMTIFNLPRLSVDIDMDFTPNYSKEDTAIVWIHFCFSIKMQEETEIISKWNLTILCDHIFLHQLRERL